MGNHIATHALLSDCLESPPLNSPSTEGPQPLPPFPPYLLPKEHFPQYSVSSGGLKSSEDETEGQFFWKISLPGVYLSFEGRGSPFGKSDTVSSQFHALPPGAPHWNCFTSSLQEREQVCSIQRCLFLSPFIPPSDCQNDGLCPIQSHFQELVHKSIRLQALL